LERSSQDKYSRRLLLDTSYVLPQLGVEVEGIEDLNEILEKRELYYPMVMVAELEAVVLKEAKKKGLERVPKQALEGLDYLVYSGSISLVPPRGEDLESTYHVLNRGWRDLFDATLYATAIRLRTEALTLDSAFKRFLKENGLEHTLLITHKELERRHKA